MRRFSTHCKCCGPAWNVHGQFGMYGAGMKCPGVGGLELSQDVQGQLGLSKASVDCPGPYGM